MKEKKIGNGWKSLGGIGVFIAFISGKLKFLIPLLKLGKFGGTIWSMLLMMGAYALIYPWSFSIGVVIMIFIHEMGHIWAAKRKGFPVSAPAFIPFLGALITLKKQPSEAGTEAYIAMGGPLLGTVGALAALGLAVATGYEVLFVIAQVGLFLNLLNLLPIHPLDGGRIVTAISRWLWAVGLIGGFFIILYLRAWIFMLIWVMFAWQLYDRYIRKKNKNVEEQLRITDMISVDRQRVEDAGILFLENQVGRVLRFTQYCRLDDSKEVCALWYPGLGYLGEVEMDRGKVIGAHVSQASAKDDQVQFEITMIYHPYPEYQTGAIREDSYYQVSPRTRLLFGVTYFGLAAFLIVMMIQVGRMIMGPMMIG